MGSCSEKWMNGRDDDEDDEDDGGD